MGYDERKPYIQHSGENRLTTFDQDGVLYDSVTLEPLDLPSSASALASLQERYVIPDGAPFSKVLTPDEKIDAALSTLRASGAIDADTLAKFEKALKGVAAETVTE